MTQRLIKATEFTKIWEIEDNSFQLTDDGLNLQRKSLEEKVVSVDLKTLRTQICCEKCKSEVILETECIKISKAAFNMVDISERFDLAALKEIVAIVAIQCQYQERRKLERK